MIQCNEVLSTVNGTNVLLWFSECVYRSLILQLSASPSMSITITNQTDLTTLCLHILVKITNKTITGVVISLAGYLFDQTMTSIKNLLLQTHLNQSIIALNPTSMFRYLSLLTNLGLLGRLLTLTAHHLSLNFPVSQSQFCDYGRTVLDKHAPASLQKVMTHNSFPWFESIRD